MGLDEYKRLDDRALEYKMAALRDNLASIRIEGSYSGGLGRAGGRGSNSNDDLFGNKDKDKRGSGGTGIGGQTPRNGRSGGDMGDDDLFSRGGRGGLDRRGSRNKRMQQKILSILGQGQGFRSSSGGRRGQNLDQEKQESLALLHREIDQFLYKVVALTVCDIRGLICLCLEDNYTTLLLPYSISSAALGSLGLLLSSSVITLAFYNTIILIITHLYLSTNP